jgi:hypothetical protein
VLVLLGDRDVEGAALERWQRLLRLRLDELDAQARVADGEAVERGDDDRARGGLEGTDANGAGDPLAAPR